MTAQKSNLKFNIKNKFTIDEAANYISAVVGETISAADLYTHIGRGALHAGIVVDHMDNLKRWAHYKDEGKRIKEAEKSGYSTSFKDVRTGEYFHYVGYINPTADFLKNSNITVTVNPIVGIFTLSKYEENKKLFGYLANNITIKHDMPVLVNVPLEGTSKGMVEIPYSQFADFVGSLVFFKIDLDAFINSCIEPDMPPPIQQDETKEVERLERIIALMAWTMAGKSKYKRGGKPNYTAIAKDAEVAALEIQQTHPDFEVRGLGEGTIRKTISKVFQNIK